MINFHPIEFLAFVACFLTTLASGQESFSALAIGYDSHVELNWEKPQNLNPDSYQIWRSADGQNFSLVKKINSNSFLDFTGFPDNSPQSWRYYISALNGINAQIAVSDTLEASVAAMSDEALLDMVQRYTFRYFWDFAHPTSGMARERNASGDIVTTGGSGFGVMAIIVGIERGWITREQGLNRLLQIVSFLQFAGSYHGAFPHWMNGANGATIPFGQFDDGGDLVETAFLMQGLLCARAYFDHEEALETALRQAIAGLWEKVDWNFYRKNNSGVLYWHWSPNYAWQENLPIRGYNEALIVYLLAIASPTHPVPASLWNTGWTAQNYASGLSWYGYQLSVGPSYGGPLFFAHYSFLGFDPRNKKDAFANYFIQNRNHTLINRAYCIANPLNHAGYADNCWGLSASDDPWGYSAHSPGSPADNGTIAPTAALSSMPYTPEESLAALKHFYRDHGAELWGPMGFYDAFNLQQNWFADSYLAIDQGPIICMIENYRTGLLWNLFMANPDIQPALEAIGFVEDLSSASIFSKETEWDIFPNPVSQVLNIDIALPSPQTISLDLLDMQGHFLKNIFNKKYLPAGRLTESIEVRDLPNGLYLLRLKTKTNNFSKKWLKFG